MGDWLWRLQKTLGNAVNWVKNYYNNITKSDQQQAADIWIQTAIAPIANKAVEAAKTATSIAQADQALSNATDLAQMNINVQWWVSAIDNAVNQVNIADAIKQATDTAIVPTEVQNAVNIALPTNNVASPIILPQTLPNTWWVETPVDAAVNLANSLTPLIEVPHDVLFTNISSNTIGTGNTINTNSTDNNTIGSKVPLIAPSMVNLIDTIWQNLVNKTNEDIASKSSDIQAWVYPFVKAYTDIFSNNSLAWKIALLPISWIWGIFWDNSLSNNIIKGSLDAVVWIWKFAKWLFWAAGDYALVKELDNNVKITRWQVDIKVKDDYWHYIDQNPWIPNSYKQIDIVQNNVAVKSFIDASIWNKKRILAQQLAIWYINKDQYENWYDEKDWNHILWVNEYNMNDIYKKSLSVWTDININDYANYLNNISPSIAKYNQDNVNKATTTANSIKSALTPTENNVKTFMEDLAKQREKEKKADSFWPKTTKALDWLLAQWPDWVKLVSTYLSNNNSALNEEIKNSISKIDVLPKTSIEYKNIQNWINKYEELSLWLSDSIWAKYVEVELLKKKWWLNTNIDSNIYATQKWNLDFAKEHNLIDNKTYDNPKPEDFDKIASAINKYIATTSFPQKDAQGREIYNYDSKNNALGWAIALWWVGATLTPEFLWAWWLVTAPIWYWIWLFQKWEYTLKELVTANITKYHPYEWFARIQNALTVPYQDTVGSFTQSIGRWLWDTIYWTATVWSRSWLNSASTIGYDVKKSAAGQISEFLPWALDITLTTYVWWGIGEWLGTAAEYIWLAWAIDKWIWAIWWLSKVTNIVDEASAINALKFWNVVQIRNAIWTVAKELFIENPIMTSAFNSRNDTTYSSNDQIVDLVTTAMIWYASLWWVKTILSQFQNWWSIWDAIKWIKGKSELNNVIWGLIASSFEKVSAIDEVGNIIKNADWTEKLVSQVKEWSFLWSMATHWLDVWNLKASSQLYVNIINNVNQWLEALAKLDNKSIINILFNHQVDESMNKALFWEKNLIKASWDINELTKTLKAWKDINEEQKMILINYWKILNWNATDWLKIWVINKLSGFIDEVKNSDEFIVDTLMPEINNKMVSNITPEQYTTISENLIKKWLNPNDYFIAKWDWFERVYKTVKDKFIEEQRKIFTDITNNC